MAAPEVMALWDTYHRTRDPEAREQLIIQHVHIAKYIAGRMKLNAPGHVEEADLLGWGILGLIEAVEKFDPTRDLQFTTYASFRVRGAILDHLRALDWAPRSLRAKARRIDAARQRLLSDLGRPPSDGELAEALEITEEDLFEALTDIHGAYVLSLDAAVTDPESGDGGQSVRACTPDEKTPSPRESARRREVVARLSQAVVDLPEQERHVLMLYYDEELTLKEIGAVLNLSESRICQIHRKALRVLRAVAEG